MGTNSTHALLRMERAATLWAVSQLQETGIDLDDLQTLGDRVLDTVYGADWTADDRALVFEATEAKATIIVSAIEDAVEAEQRFTENVARFVEEGVLPSDVADEDDDDETDATEVEAPAWLETMRFCHISPADDDRTTFCGIKVEDLPNGLVDDHPTGWDGEAICVDCGLPICPRCAQLSALEDALAA